MQRAIIINHSAAANSYEIRHVKRHCKNCITVCKALFLNISLKWERRSLKRYEVSKNVLFPSYSSPSLPLHFKLPLIQHTHMLTSNQSLTMAKPTHWYGEIREDESAGLEGRCLGSRKVKYQATPQRLQQEKNKGMGKGASQRAQVLPFTLPIPEASLSPTVPPGGRQKDPVTCSLSSCW